MAADAPLEALVNSLAMALPFTSQEKQALLEAGTVAERVDTLTILLKIDGTGEDGSSASPLQ
jgi:Lon protease-like protein